MSLINKGLSQFIIINPCTWSVEIHTFDIWEPTHRHYLTLRIPLIDKHWFIPIKLHATASSEYHVIKFTKFGNSITLPTSQPPLTCLWYCMFNCGHATCAHTGHENNLHLVYFMWEQSNMFSLSIIPLGLGVHSRRLSILKLATLPLSLQEQVLKLTLIRRASYFYLAHTQTIM